ncbi:cytochrome P450 6k1 [Camponotus floridanus]|uniref:cytochrome P450 6k1 n=1 Tax=Camponotus floridanus TaxID=104421 RepID=UPI000DC6663A|nr:cytochrome P450 6k1 [Camponotus floridanus]
MAILTDCVLLDTLLVFSLLFVTLFLWLKWKHSYWQRRGVRTLPAHWFFGHLKDAMLLRKSAGVIIGELHRQAADEDNVIGIYILYKPFLLVRNPELIKQIMIKDFHLFPNRHFDGKSNSDTLGNWSLFSVKNPEWRQLRTKMSPVFTSGKLKSLFLLMQESGEMMREYLQGQFADSNIVSISVKDLFSKYTTIVIASMAFGIRANCFDTPPPEFFVNSQKAFLRNLSVNFRFFFLFFLPEIGKYLGLKTLGDYTDYFRKVFWDSMDNRNITKTKRGDLIDSLLQLKNENADDTDFRFEGDILLAQAALFFGAGRETSITTMTYALCELAKYPEMQRRAREEILEEIQTANGVTYEAVNKMKYLHQVINETLRLYPSAPVLDRISIEDYMLPNTNITIEKGIPIYVALYGIQRDPRFYKDPERFNPERFSDEGKNEIVPYTFLPFGEGPRNCIGMRLGILQTAIGLIAILRDYEVSLNPSWMSITDTRRVFTSSPAGFLLDLKKI